MVVSVPSYLGVYVQVPIQPFCNNVSTSLIFSLALHNCCKHFKVDNHFVQEIIDRRHVQFCDIMT